jgi:hypothetical protein
LDFKEGRPFGSAGTVPSDILLLSSWQASRQPMSKNVLTPMIGGDVIQTGEAITTRGGDNSTLNGVEEVEGVNRHSLVCLNHFHQRLRNVEGEKLGCVFVLGGRIAVKITETQRKDLTSICFVSDRKREQRNKDNVSMRFSLSEGWSDNQIVKPIHGHISRT